MVSAWCPLGHAMPTHEFDELPDDAWQVISHARGLLVGGTTKTAIQIIFDPNCPYSAKLYKYLARRHPTTAVRWVPVTYFKRDSDALALSILEATSPAAALARNFSNYDAKTQHGGYEVRSGALGSPIVNQALKREWSHWGGGTPLVVVRTPKGTVLMQGGANDAEAIDRLLERADGLKGY